MVQPALQEAAEDLGHNNQIENIPARVTQPR